MPRTLKLPPRKRLLQLLIYNKQTGILIWKHRSGVAAGVPINRQVMIDGIRYRTSRIIWRMMTGRDPGMREVDHKDIDEKNNSWANLRLATHQQNKWNKRVYRNNKLGVTGIRLVNKTVYLARALDRHSNEVIVGRFTTLRVAVTARDNYIKTARGQFARLSQ